MSQEIWHGQKIVINFVESHPKFGKYFCTKYFEIGSGILSFGYDKSELKIELVWIGLIGFDYLPTMASSIERLSTSL